MRSRHLLLALVVAGVTAPAASAADQRPETIPALQEWKPSGGDAWRPGRNVRIVVRHADRRALLPEAFLLAGDLQTRLKRPVKVTARRGTRARSGDIVLGRNTARSRLGDEGYQLRIGRAYSILAPTTAGTFYGGRTLLQLLKGDTGVPRGRAVDFPRYPERGLMVDDGRKYYTPGWLIARIKEMAYFKLNYLHLHLSDNQGFRIESASHPEVMSDKYLTAADVRQILDVARRHHVVVVPEIDMPGHMGYLLSKHPEFQLADRSGSRQASVLDVSNPAAVAFARDLVNDMLALFPGPYYHQGGDEVMMPATRYYDGSFPQLEAYARQRFGPDANARDAIRGFENDLGELVRARGRTPRMWNDDLQGYSTVQIAPRIIEWWSEVSAVGAEPTYTPAELLQRGHQVANGSWFPTYFVNGVGGSDVRVTPDLKRAYETWDVNDFPGDAATFVPTNGATLPADDRRLRGVIMHVWNDNPALHTEQDDTPWIAPGFPLFGQKAWRSPLLAEGYDAFQRIASRLGSGPA